MSLANPVLTAPLSEAGDAANRNYRFTDLSMRNWEPIRAMGMLPGLLRRWSRDRDRMIGRQHVAAHRMAATGSFTRFLRLAMQSLILGLGAYLVITFDGAVAQQWQPEQRCAVVQDMVSVLAAGATAFVFHPYPITPYHGDYLYHFDRIEMLKSQYLRRSAGLRESFPHPLTVRAHGALAAQLMRPPWQRMAQRWVSCAERFKNESLAAQKAPPKRQRRASSGLESLPY